MYLWIVTSVQIHDFTKGDDSTQNTNKGKQHMVTQSCTIDCFVTSPASFAVIVLVYTIIDGDV